MHYRFFVTFDKDRVTTSQEARRYVFGRLHDEGFCAQGRWGMGMADWLVIGGRWSGELSRHSWGKSLDFVMASIEQEKGVCVWGAWYPDKAKQRLQQKLAHEFQDMWDTGAPDSYTGIPIERDTYEEYGYEDDAMILTQELYDTLLKQYAGQEESEYHADLDNQPVSPAMVDTKWIVVVDYHN